MNSEQSDIALILPRRPPWWFPGAALLAAALSGVVATASFAAPPESPNPEPSSAVPGIVQPLAAPSSDGISRTILGGDPIAGTDLEMRMVLTVFPPGAGLPPHHHPSTGFNYVLEGAALSQYGGEPLQTFTAGQSFQDKAGIEHTVFRNASTTQPLKYLIFYAVRRGTSFLLVP